ncbi:MAG: MarC family protein [Treponema sp.]|jgi:multiple antibiotic resistance protein|nr:MarC family protein [Treponema sp.]
MLSQFLPVFFTMFIVIDPIGLVPLYIGLSSRVEPERKKRIIRSAVCISFGVLLGFILLGKHILALLGIEVGSFFIAGGIMLFIVSMEMLFGKPNQSKVSSREQSGAPGGEEDGQSMAVFPLAIPMLAGPGSITAIILYTGSAGDTKETGSITMMVMLILALLIIMAIVWIALRASELILRILGKTGVSVLERIMGLLLSGLSVQFVYDGIVRLGLIPGLS